MPVFPATFDSLAIICERVRQAAINAGFSPVEVYEIELAVDEACSNIIEHSYGGEGLGEIECKCINLKTEFKIILKDSGCSFDPSSIAEPDLVSPVNKRHEGGLGIFYMRHAVDEIRFEPCEGSGTILKMTKHKKAGERE